MSLWSWSEIAESLDADRLIEISGREVVADLDIRST
jgi:hypothetical protein